MAQVRDKKTGAMVDLPDEQLGSAILSGQYEVDPKARVPVVSPLNTVGTMTAEEFVKTGPGQGYRPATPTEFLEAQEHVKYGEGMAPVRAFAEGVARGALTEFVADPTMIALGASPEGLAKRKTENPLAEPLGQFVGFGVPALLGGGAARGAAGVAEIGGRAALRDAAQAGSAGGLRQILAAGVKATPAALISKAARAIEAGAVRAVGENTAAKLATSAAVVGLEGAVYGAGMGAGELAREGVTIKQVLDDPDMLAESILAGAKTGAMWGAGGALALGGLAGTLGAAGRFGGKAISGLRRGAVEAETDLSRMTAAQQIAVKAEKEAVPMLKVRAIEERKALAELEKTQTNITHSMASDLSRLEVIRDKVFEDMTIARKLKTITKVMAEDPPTLEPSYIVAKTDELVTGLKNTVDDIVKNPGARFDMADVTRVKKGLQVYLDPAVDRIRKIAMKGGGPTADDLPKIYAELDQIKRRTQQVTKSVGGYVFEPMDAHAEALRANLLDPEYWGQKAIDIQGPDNIAWEKALANRGPYSKEVLRWGYGPTSASKYDKLPAADPVKTESAVKSAHEVYQGQEVQFAPRFIREHVPNEADLISQLVASHEGGPQYQRLAAEAQEIKARVLAGMDEASTTATMAQSARERAELLGQIPLVGKVVVKGINLADAARQAADWGAIKIRTTNAINKNVGAFIKRARELGEGGAQRAKRLIGPAGAQVKERGPLSERFQQKLIEHERYDDEQRLAENTIASLGGMGDVAPTLAVSLVSAEMRKGQFLQSKRPVPLVRASDVFAHLQKVPRVCDSEMARYLRYAEGVDDPMKTIRDFGTGKVSREGAEALRVVYPRLYGEMEKAITDKLIAQKKPLPYKSLINLSILLDRPLHPSMEPGFIAASQKVYQGQTEEQKGLTPENRQVPDMAKNQMTQSQRLSA